MSYKLIDIKILCADNVYSFNNRNIWSILNAGTTHSRHNTCSHWCITVQVVITAMFFPPSHELIVNPAPGVC